MYEGGESRMSVPLLTIAAFCPIDARCLPSLIGFTFGHSQTVKFGGGTPPPAPVQNSSGNQLAFCTAL